MIGRETILTLLQEQSRTHPERIAILGVNREPLTYRHLFQNVETVAAELNKLGIGRHERVAIVLPNGPEMAVAFLAIASCATSAPLNPSYQESEFEFYLTDLNTKALIVSANFESPVLNVAHQHNIPIIELSPIGAVAGTFILRGEGTGMPVSSGYAQTDDVALVLHTSGTTSRPKIVPLTHRNILTSAHNIRSTLELTENDRCLNVMVLFHIHGLMAALMASLVAGGSVVCAPGFLAPFFFEWLAKFHPTWYTAVPSIHQSILARAQDNQAIIDQLNLRFVRSSSSSLAPSVMADLEQTFNAPVVEAYGMTEASHQMTSNPLPPQPRYPGTVGRAAGPEVAIMHESDNRLLSMGERGEIVIRGTNVTLGYASNKEANEKAFTNGWFRTGDQGFFNEDGYLSITGRLKEIINRGGEKIPPREIDEVLLEHPGVNQAVAFGIPNPILGEEVGAAVVLCDLTVTAQELRRFVATHLASFKVPYQLVIVDAIPKGPTGKLQRIGLAEKLGLKASESLSNVSLSDSSVEFVAPQTHIQRQLADVWSEVLNLPKVSVTQRFLDSGGDSMTAVQLINHIQQTFALRLSVTDLFDAPTIREQAVIVARLLESQEVAQQKVPEIEKKSLQLIQAGNQNQPSLFLVPGNGGGEEEFLIYARLIYLLGDSQPVYGFFARGQDGDTLPHTNVTDMVEDYLVELREVQPQGPYFLSGECIGGKLAYEMACRLDAEGETVSLLLMNTQLQKAITARQPNNNLLSRRAKYHWAQWQKRSSEGKIRYLIKKIHNWQKILKASPLNPAIFLRKDFQSFRQVRDGRKLYSQILRRHIPTTLYKQRLSLIVSEDYEDHYGQTPKMAVGRWVEGELDIYPVAGDIDSYLDDSHVETTAQQVCHFLQSAFKQTLSLGERKKEGGCD